VFRLTLPRVAGAELVGSPLPLAPDETELAEGPSAGGLAETNGASVVLADGALVVVGQPDQALDDERQDPGTAETVTTPAGAAEPASRG
jgi:hypothetical protein